MLLYPKATARLMPYTPPAMGPSLGLVLHVQQGNGSPGPMFAGLVAPNRRNAHWWVSKTGAVEEYVSADLQSWAQKDGNPLYHSAETEGWDTEPLTPAQVASLAELYRWGVQTFGWPLQLADAPGTRGFGWHGMGGAAWGGHYGCPGDLRKAQRQAILDAARISPSQEDDMEMIRTPDGEIDLVIGKTLIHLDGPGYEFYKAQSVPLKQVRQQDGDRARQGA